jgi:GT2 family glycosyltransferase
MGGFESKDVRVDVVVPFFGSDEDLRGLLAALAHLDLRADDTLTVVDNRPGAGAGTAPPGMRLVAAPERQSSYHARNRGAAGAQGDWLLFLDADVIAPRDLIDRYLQEPPADGTAVLAGAVRDEPPAAEASFAVRYSSLRGTLDQGNTLGGEWSYAQTANCAVRRSAFEAVGGFREDIRSGGDADLCFRLRAAGWGLESRDRAEVMHRSRPTVRRLLRQRLRHGSGAGWLDREYPGSAPGHGNWPGLAKWTAQTVPRAALRCVREPRQDAMVELADVGVQWALELGRLLPNEVREPRERARAPGAAALR